MKYKSISIGVLTAFATVLAMGAGETVCTDSFVQSEWLTVKSILIMLLIWTLGLASGAEK